MDIMTHTHPEHTLFYTREDPRFGVSFGSPRPVSSDPSIEKNQKVQQIRPNPNGSTHE